MLTAQEADARGCSGTSPAANASKLRCLKPDVQSADEQIVEVQIEGEENADEEGEEGEENEGEDDQDEEGDEK